MRYQKLRFVELEPLAIGTFAADGDSKVPDTAAMAQYADHGVGHPFPHLARHHRGCFFGPLLAVPGDVRRRAPRSIARRST